MRRSLIFMTKLIQLWRNDEMVEKKIKLNAKKD